MMLVTYDQALVHLRADGEDERDDIILKIHAASGVVLNYLKSGAKFLDEAGQVKTDADGNPQGIPYEVQAATLLMLGYLYKDRDENANGAFEQGFLPKPVTALLYPLRDPAFA
jgi:hypothetical protein